MLYLLKYILPNLFALTKLFQMGGLIFFKNDLIVVINLLLTLDSGSFNVLENEEISCLAKYFITDNKADSIKIGLY